MYVLLFKCVDNNVSFYFMFSLCHVPFTMLKKSVNKWTSNENCEKNVLICFIVFLKMEKKIEKNGNGQLIKRSFSNWFNLYDREAV